MGNMSGEEFAPTDVSAGSTTFKSAASPTPITVEPVASPPTDSAAPSGEPALSVDGVTKVFAPSPAWLKVLLKSAIKEPVLALDDVSFQLEPGETCVVVGPNGAGKSTLFRILTGLTTPTSGQARILGHDIAEGRRVRSLIGYMPAEDRNLMLRHTCGQNLEFRGKLQGIAKHELKDRVDAALEQVGIAHARDRAAVSLSTGMKARLQLAAALLHRPEVLILDEPTSTVDPVGAHELLTLLEELTAADGLSIVLSSHRLEEIDALDDKVVFLDRGRVIHDGNLGQLRHVWEIPRYRMTFDPSIDVVALGQKLAIEPGFEVDVLDSAPTGPDTPAEAVVEVATQRPVGRVMASLGPAAEAVTSFDQVVMPLRMLFHKLVNDEMEARR